MKTEFSGKSCGVAPTYIESSDTNAQNGVGLFIAFMIVKSLVSIQPHIVSLFMKNLNQVGSILRTAACFALLTMNVLAADGTISPAVTNTAKKIVLIAGKKSHGPEGNRIHDYPWSVKLLKVLLEQSDVREKVSVETYFDGWPKNEKPIEDADTVFILSDGRDGNLFSEAPHLENAERISFMERLMKRGCGFGVIHFSTFAPEVYRDQILRWSGGYFQWETDGERKWYSAIKVLDTELSLPSPRHAISRGVKPFRMKEEFYYNLRFSASDKSLSPLLAVPALSGREPDGRCVAWAREREDGGRGFGTTCGHFYDNWKNDDFRKLVLNALVWSAHIEVPELGIESTYREHDEISAHLSTSVVPVGRAVK